MSVQTVEFNFLKVAVKAAVVNFDSSTENRG